MRLLGFIVGVLVAGAAWAQQPPSMAERNMSLVINQLGPAVSLYAEEIQRQLALKDARIKELEEKCGEACKK